MAKFEVSGYAFITESIEADTALQAAQQFADRFDCIPSSVLDGTTKIEIAGRCKDGDEVILAGDEMYHRDGMRCPKHPAEGGEKYPW